MKILAVNQNSNISQNQQSFKGLMLPKENYEKINEILIQNGFKNIGVTPMKYIFSVINKECGLIELAYRKNRLTNDQEFGIIQPPGPTVFLYAKTKIEVEMKKLLDSIGISAPHIPDFDLEVIA